jgi:hypothetical protein
MAGEHFGEALSGPYPVAGGEARLFEHGVVISGADGEVEAPFRFPMIGRPHIATGDAANAAIFERTALMFVPGRWDVETLAGTLRAALAERVALLPTAGPPTPTPLTWGASEIVVPGGDQQPTYGLRASAALAERQLYDVGVRADTGEWRRVAPHAVYYRAAWSDFGIAHVTDIHVARRIDSFRERLENLGYGEAAAQMYNWNDRFRGFIRYANYLHGLGMLDLILATGDIIDYIFERHDDEGGGGNALWARLLILGQAPGPHFPDVEELRVPIFMVPGNHDYRKHPYYLLFNLDAGLFNVHQFTNFSGYHLSWREALAVTRGDNKDDVPELSADSAARMVEVDPHNQAYATYLADRRGYIVRLGRHCIAMLDSGPDVGMVTSRVDALKEWLGWASEDEQTFVGGSPNSEGIEQWELRLVEQALRDTPADGVFILGLHSPLLNVWDSVYPYYLRETQRPAYPAQVAACLWRADGAFAKPHPNWYPPEGEATPPTYVARRGVDDRLDYGVSRGKTAELINLLAGIGSPRPADLVLQGHNHRSNEFRVGRMGDDIAFFMDFYTHNPVRYYPTRFSTGQDVDDSDVTYVEVVEGALVAGAPWPLPYEAKHQYTIAVPPYASPLATAPDARAWWAAHRPLLLQTGALGPMENNQVSFSGFRVISVRGDVIDKIHQVSIDRLQASDYRLPWEEAIRPEPRRPHRYLPRTLEVGAPKAAGAPCGHVFPGNGAQVIFYRDGNGRLIELWELPTGERGWGDLTAAAGNATPAADDPSVFMSPQEGLQVVLYRGTDGHVHSLYYAAGAVGHDALSGVAGAPKATGRPMGMFASNYAQHIVMYRRDNGHLITLWWQGQAPPGHEDPTVASGAKPAAGDPAPYFDPVRGDHIVVYRATDGHIHDLYWSTGAVGHDDMSGYAGAPEAAGDPVAYKTEYDDAHQISYRGVDGHIHELWWVGTAPLNYWDLSAVAGAPPAASDPSAYVSLRTRTKHVLYRGTDNHVHAIWWAPGAGDPAHVDLTLAALAPPAADRPWGFPGATTEHVVYRGTDGQIHEIRWS